VIGKGSAECHDVRWVFSQVALCKADRSGRGQRALGRDGGASAASETRVATVGVIQGEAGNNCPTEPGHCPDSWSILHGLGQDQAMQVLHMSTVSEMTVVSAMSLMCGMYDMMSTMYVMLSVTDVFDLSGVSCPDVLDDVLDGVIDSVRDVCDLCDKCDAHAVPDHTDMHAQWRA
jgi:hypothetical protein